MQGKSNCDNCGYHIEYLEEYLYPPGIRLYMMFLVDIFTTLGGLVIITQL